MDSFILNQTQRIREEELRNRSSVGYVWDIYVWHKRDRKRRQSVSSQTNARNLSGSRQKNQFAMIQSTIIAASPRC